MLKMVCDPFYPGLNVWMNQIEYFRAEVEMCMEVRGNKNMKKELTLYRKNANKTSPDRKLTRLDEMLQQAWGKVTAFQDGILAKLVVVKDSMDTIHVYSVPPICPLTLEQIVQQKCFPRKVHFGPDLGCEGKARPNDKQEKTIETAKKVNETLDDFWFRGDVPDASRYCPKGSYIPINQSF